MRQVFPIVPATGSIYAVIVPAMVILVAMFALMAYLAYSTRHVRAEISEDGLRIAGDLYGRLIPPRELITSEARIVDLTSDTSLCLRRRTNGAALPGYRSGWFRLVNGDKALVFVTDLKRVAYVPTTSGYSVLLSVAEPDAFLAALRTVH